MRIPEISLAVRTAENAAPKLEELEKASKDIEGLFLKDLLAAMRRGLPGGMLGNVPGKEIFEDMFDQALAESASRNGTLGIGKLLYNQLSPTVLRESLAKALSAGTPNRPSDP